MLATRNGVVTISDSNPTVRLDDASKVWDILAERIDSLIEGWEAVGDPPALKEFLPESPPNLRYLALVELIKVDLEYRWKRHNLPRKVEEYAAEFPELCGEGGIPSDLIYEEYHVRTGMGDPPTPEEYFERFPDRVDELKQLMGLHSPNVTTSMFAASKAPKVNVGDKIDDFDLLAELGSGAFATVYLARQNSLQRLVALKISADSGTEPQTLAQLDHPHIVRVYDQRVLSDPPVRLLYMQYVAGGTMQRVVQMVRQTPASERTGKILFEAVDRALELRGESAPESNSTRSRLSRSSWPETVCWLAVRMASALGYAHRKGVLHRDIKPANVLLAADATPKLVDFNISFSSQLDGATPAAYFGGSLAYMSPEQLEACNTKHPREAADLDARADIYSLGVMLWELLCGQRPFLDEEVGVGWTATLEAMTDSRREGVPQKSIDALPADLPSGMKEVLLDCISPDIEQRPKTADELARQLSLCLQPHAQQLLRPKGFGWRQVVRIIPAITLSLAALVPNIALSVFNILYNVKAIEELLKDPKLIQFFWSVMVGSVNSLAYSVGLALAIGMALPVIRALWKLRRKQEIPNENLPFIRRRCLSIGNIVSWIVIALWVASGIGIPVGLEYGASSPSGLPWNIYLHLFISQVLCGLIAATITFFLMSLVCIRSYYPLLLRPESIVEEDADALRTFERRVWVQFGLSISVPIVATLVVAISNLPRELMWVQTVIAAIGLGSFGFAFWMLRTIQADVAALLTTVGPPRDALSSSDTMDSFWTDSR
ncbi:unnamed protein product [Cladocopium goreaui]|uniref:NEK6-subfamily protein kinase n=1 Tax=Cladocopium goreaui TaxID=2562237 RepID=A0A9P1BEA8_9DINO|nr:unnamed protein product [Cladocopium goreaui]